jgi:hypothetical protein
MPTNPSANSLLINTQDVSDCCICYIHIDNPVEYYKCHENYNKILQRKSPIRNFHIICKVCFKNCESAVNNNIISNRCPMCKAELCNEYISPDILSKSELLSIDIKKIPNNSIYIQQSLILDPKTKIITINTGKNKIQLYSLYGNLVLYSNMFVNPNGFLYEYNEMYSCYHLAIRRQKYQFWDVSRVTISK